MKRLLLLGMLTVSVVAMSGCRWCGWGRQGDVCNACQGPADYAGESYYGGEVYGGEVYGGQAYDGQVIQQGMPNVPSHVEVLPNPQGAR